MLKECSKMYIFKHPNVLSLMGVCLDGGTAPYIIMPFMANGSLLAYLKNNRKSLVIYDLDKDDEEVLCMLVDVHCITLKLIRWKLLVRDWQTCVFKLLKGWNTFRV